MFRIGFYKFCYEERRLIKLKVIDRIIRRILRTFESFRRPRSVY